MNSRRNFVVGVAASTVLVGSKGLLAAPAIPQDENKKLDAKMVGRFVGKSHGDIETVKDLLKKEPSLVNATHDWGGGDFETALGAASHVGRREIAELLLEHGARIDVFAATMLGMKGVVQELLKIYPDLHAVRGPHQIPMLSHAIFGRDKAVDVFHLLIEAGADVNAASSMNMTPLMAAATLGQVSQVELLLDKGAAPNVTDSKDRTALEMASKREHKSVVRLLEKAMKKPSPR